jgi:hypothetical protein
MKAIVFGLILFSTSLFADDDSPFDIMELPQGASVTLPSPATTLVPMTTHYRVAPTDKAQVFRISAPAQACAVKVQVFDKNSEEVKIATLRGGESMIYRFERLNGVRIQSSPIEKCVTLTKLVLDSNRPLEIGM